MRKEGIAFLMFFTILFMNNSLELLIILKRHIEISLYTLVSTGVMFLFVSSIFHHIIYVPNIFILTI